MAINQLPRYTFDPVTQTYKLIAPEAPVAVKPLYELGPADVADASAVSSPNPAGSAGFVGDAALALGGYSQAFGGLAPGAMVAGFAADVLGNAALDQQAQIDADIATANLAGTPVATTSSFMSGNAVTTDPQTISGLQGLAAANAAQNAQAVSNAQAANSAAQAAAAVAEVADAVDAEAGAAMDAGVSGAASEASHAADGNDSGSGGGDGGSTSTDSGGFSESDSTNAGDSDSDTYYKGGQVMNYAQGGVAAAKQAQSMGRGQDTMLVHMTPGEVGGLQALAKAGGGSLTVNPKTGLYEAGFLSSMLPMVAGAALTGLTGGVVNPMTASLLVGGGYGLATGSLKKGLMAGLGAFGGANIAAGLGASAAAGTAENLAAPAVESSMATPLEIAQTNIDPALLESGMSAEQVMTQGLAGSPTAQGAVMSAGQYAPTINAMDVANLRTVPSMTVTGVPAASPTGFVQGDYMGNLSQMGKGAQNMFASGQPGVDARAAFMRESGGLSSIAPAAAPILSQEPEPVQKKPSYVRRYNVDVANRSELGSEYAPGSTYERNMVDYTYSPQPIYQAASGGLTSLAKGGTAKKKSKSPGGDSYYKFAQDRRDTSMQGAIDANFASGGQPRFLSGGGDGMSDDIPATIDGKQPARLADGEFVVPADVVSHLGNGSSKAGAKKLYKMMDRIRHARTGKKSQAPEVKAERHMPA
jgi:hypothetical protein